MKCSLMTDVNGGRIEDGNSAKLREEEAWGRISGQRSCIWARPPRLTWKAQFHGTVSL